ncbi:MAG: AI-2E family transporter [Leptospirales bacterium]|nr:AI-2E family transporter [Leptospirales bacterium]
MRSESSHLPVQIGFLALVAAFAAVMAAGAAALALPIAIAFLAALALNPAVDFLEGAGLPRMVSATVVFLAFLLVTGVAVYLGGGALVDQIQELSANKEQLQQRTLLGLSNLRSALADTLPASVVQEHLDPQKNLERIESALGDMRPADLSFLGEAVTYIIITPMIAFILLLQGQVIYRSLLSLAPNRYFEMTLLLVNNIRRQIVAYIKGLGIQWLIMASIAAPGFMFVGLPYGPLVGVLVATTNIVPYIGPGMGAATALAVALMEPGGHLILPALAVVGVAQLVDNVFTQPVVLAGSVQVHPIIAILAVITMQQWFGMAGMVVAIPLASILVASIQIIYRQLKAFGAL